MNRKTEKSTFLLSSDVFDLYPSSHITSDRPLLSGTEYRDKFQISSGLLMEWDGRSAVGYEIIKCYLNDDQQEAL